MFTFFKKTLVSSFAILSLISVPAPLYASQFVTVTKDNVNVRTGPSANTAVRLQVFKGYPLKVLSKKGGWYKVSDFEHDQGWIADFLTKSNDTVIVDVKNYAYIRAQPNAKSDAVATVDRGVVLTKTGIQGDWIQVRHSSGISGWIFGKLVWP